MLAGVGARALALSALAVLAVVAVVAVLQLTGGGAPSSGLPTAARSTDARPTTTRLTAAPSTAVPTHPAPAPTPGSSVAKAPLTVLNNSRIRGLADRATGDFHAGGWPIRYVGNFTGRVVDTTVYYGPGQLAVAEQLARQFPAIARVLPRFDGLPGQGLTVVVTRHYTD